MSNLLPSLRRSVVALSLAAATLVAASALAAGAAGVRPALTTAAGPEPRLEGRVPDLAVVVAPAPGPDAAHRAAAAAAGVPGVAAAGMEPVAGGDGAGIMLVTAADPALAAALAPLVRDRVAAAVPGAEVAVGGRAVDDVAVVASLERDLALAVAPVVVLAALAAGAALGARRGVGVAAAATAAVAAAWALHARLALPFDGSLARTALPPVLAALGASVTASLWVLRGDGLGRRRPRAELVAVAVALAGAAAATWAWSAGHGALAPIAAGAAVGLVVATVVAAPLGGGREAGWSRRGGTLVPDGRRFPPLVLVGFAAALVGLAVAAPGPLAGDRLDGGSLHSQPVSRVVAATLGGDPTAGMVASFPPATGHHDVAAWAASVSALPGIASVEAAGQRWRSGQALAERSAPERSAPERSASERSASERSASERSASERSASERSASERSASALVVPVDGGRSEAAQRTAALVARLAVPQGPVELSGAPAEALAGAGRQDRLVAATVAALALLSGLVVLVLGRDLVLAAAAVALRLASLAAGAGALRLAGGPVNGAEVEVVVALVGSLALLADGGLVAGARRAVRAGRPPEPAIDLALARRAVPALAGLAAVAGVGTAAVGGELDALRRLGAATVVLVGLVAVVELWLLRPALVAARWGRARAAHLPAPDPSPSGAWPTLGADPAARWRPVVNALLRAEYLCQRRPTGDGLGDVVVVGSPLWDELAAHQRHLCRRGLRVEGPPPQLVELEVLRPGSPATVLVTIAHQDRVVVDRQGRPVEARPAHWRRGMLWLVRDPSGRYRIGEAVDLGPVPAPDPVPSRPALAAPRLAAPGRLPATAGV